MRYLLLIILIAILAPIPAKALTASDVQKYVDEKIAVQNISTASEVAELKSQLEFEVNRIIDKGHLEPAYFELGIIGSIIVGGNMGEQVYALATAIPYLTPATQTRLKTFLSQEIRNYDPTAKGIEHCDSGWGNCEMTGNRREYFQIPTSPAPDPIKANVYPEPSTPVENIYAVWGYAYYTNDWSFIGTTLQGTRWDKIKALFNKIPATPTRYGEIIGAIGYARILDHYNQRSDTTYQQALSKIASGMTASTNMQTLLTASYQKFLIPGGHDWAFTVFHYLRQQNASGAFFAPELGRYLRDHALESVRKVVTVNPNPADPPAIESYWPTWYLTRGPYPRIRPWVGHYGENHMLTPDTPWAIFMIQAYVYNKDGPSLLSYLSSPYNVGDTYHISKSVATLEAFGERCWQNIQTGSSNCAAAVCPNDLNSDGERDLTDYSIMAANFFKNPITDSKADINSDGSVDLTDYSLLAKDFLESCN